MSSRAHLSMESKVGRVYLGSLQRSAQDAQLVVQLRACCKVSQICLCPLLFLHAHMAD